MSDREETLTRLARDIAHCRKCRLHLSRTHAVPGEGAPSAPAMLVGEAPGEQEDRLGRPFIGPTRRFFDQLLQDFGLSRELLFVTSSVKCRPPSNRDPLDDELATCRANWLDPQIRAVDPAVIVLLGLAAVRSLLGPSGKLRELHGTRHRYDGRELLVSYHPTAGMRFPRVRRAMYEDFALLRNSLSED